MRSAAAIGGLANERRRIRREAANIEYRPELRSRPLGMPMASGLDRCQPAINATTINATNISANNSNPMRR
jgi:hypothetical protein